MDRFLQGKIAIVTGGTRGIGRAITESLLDAGASVAICGRSQSSVDRAVGELAARGGVIGKSADVSKPEDVENLFRFVDEKLQGLDILINNAGLGVFRSVVDLSIEDWRSTVETNLSGVFYCSREAL